MVDQLKLCLTEASDDVRADLLSTSFVRDLELEVVAHARPKAARYLHSDQRGEKGSGGGGGEGGGNRTDQKWRWVLYNSRRRV